MDITNALADVLSSLKFRRSGQTWRRSFDEVIQVVNVQKFGSRRFVNIGLFLKGLGELDAPPERLCHLRIRLDSLCEAELSTLHDTIESRQDGGFEHADLNWERMEKHLIEFLSTMVSEKSIVESLRSGRYSIHAITLQARALLGL